MKKENIIKKVILKLSSEIPPLILKGLIERLKVSTDSEYMFKETYKVIREYCKTEDDEKLLVARIKKERIPNISSSHQEFFKRLLVAFSHAKE